MTLMNMAKAINLALMEAMSSDEKVIVMGEDVGADEGVFRITEGLHAKFGDNRVIDTPLAESGIVGTASHGHVRYASSLRNSIFGLRLLQTITSWNRTRLAPQSHERTPDRASGDESTLWRRHSRS